MINRGLQHSAQVLEENSSPTSLLDHKHSKRLTFLLDHRHSRPPTSQLGHRLNRFLTSLLDHRLNRPQTSLLEHKLNRPQTSLPDHRLNRPQTSLPEHQNSLGPLSKSSKLCPAGPLQLPSSRHLHPRLSSQPHQPGQILQDRDKTLPLQGEPQDLQLLKDRLPLCRGSLSPGQAVLSGHSHPPPQQVGALLTSQPGPVQASSQVGRQVPRELSQQG